MACCAVPMAEGFAPAATISLNSTGFGSGTVDFGIVRYSQDSLSNGQTNQQVTLINGTSFGTAYFSTYDNIYNNPNVAFSPVPTFISGIHSTTLNSSGGGTAAVALNYLSSLNSYPLTGLGTPQPGIKVIASGYDYFVAGPTSAGLQSGQDQLVPITATLVTPVPTLSTDASLVGQTVPFGQTASFNLTVANTAVADLSAPANAQALTVSAVNVNSGNNEFSVSSNSSQSFVLQPQASQAVTINFTPNRSLGGGLQGTTIYLTDDYGHDFGTTASDGYNAITFSAYAPAIVTAGTGAAAQALGGKGVIGGVGATLSSTAGGDFGANFSEPTAAQLPGAVNFPLPGAVDQEWDLTYSGALTAPATIVLHFDPSLISSSVNLGSLTIEHYTNGAWVNLTSVVDPTADTITFQTSSFSPFALGVSVPEPASISLLGICPILLLRRRRVKIAR